MAVRKPDSRDRIGPRPHKGTWPEALDQLKAAKACLDAARIMLMKDDTRPELAEDFVKFVTEKVSSPLVEMIELVEYQHRNEDR